MLIRMNRTVGPLKAGYLYNVARIVPHGGNSDAPRQFVVIGERGEQVHVLDLEKYAVVEVEEPVPPIESAIDSEPFVTKQLRKAAEIYEERNALYGDNYKHFGEAVVGIFPRGVTLETVDDFNRFSIFMQMIAKATRYAQMFTRGGHIDSLDDLSVYSQMLQELDHEISERGEKE